MVVGIGIDILKIGNLNTDNLKENDPFLLANYTSLEIRAAGDRENPLYYYATRFAGKEAVFKALNSASHKIRFHDIEILNMESGQPYVTLYGALLKEARKVGIQKVLISLSYDCDYAIAYATAIGRNM